MMPCVHICAVARMCVGFYKVGSGLQHGVAAAVCGVILSRHSDGHDEPDADASVGPTDLHQARCTWYGISQASNSSENGGPTWRSS